MSSPKSLMTAFLTAVADSPESDVLIALQKCREAAGFLEACKAGALDACRVVGPRGTAVPPLHVAASRGLAACVKQLLDMGASPSLVAEVRYWLRTSSL